MEENSTSNIITSLDTISNDMFIDFCQISNYEQVSEKEKLITRITKNINVIKNLYQNKVLYDTTIINSILISLKSMRIIDNKNNSLSDYKKIRKALGHIIYDIYRYSDYHALMSNIPSSSILSTQYNLDDIDDTEPVNSEVIYATIENYIGINTVDSVFQVSEYNYLVKLKIINDAKKLCDLLNKMQIGNNIIKVEALRDIDIDIEKDLEKDLVSNESEIKDSEISISITENQSSLDINEKEEDIDIPEDSENIVHITNSFTNSFIDLHTSQILKEFETEFEKSHEIIEPICAEQSIDKKKNFLVVDIAYDIYNKISNAFSFFRRS